jgi:ATP-dependent RNA helicase RhlE
MSETTFADLGVSTAVANALAERGMHSPFAVQTLALPDALAGRDILVSSPTGSGKTIAFGVALVDGIEATDPRPSALVLVPTRELATQIVDEIREIAHSRALAITAVFGGAGLEKQSRLASRSHIVVATPGRLEDLLQRRALTLADVKLLVLDEADRMLDMGFQPAVKRIVAQTNPDRQTLFLSATLDGRVGDLARAYTRDPKLIEYAPVDENKVNIEHRFRQVTRDDKVDQLVDQLSDKDRGLAVVFVKTKFGADKLVRKLSSYQVEAVALHGNRSQAQRRKALAAFEDGRVTTLVATDVAARGLDVDGVTHVIQYDIPIDMETYTHRVGRTGRAGRSGIGITFVEPEEQRDVGVMGRDLELADQLQAAGLRVAEPGEKGPGVQRRQGGGSGRGGAGGGGRGRQGGGGRGGDHGRQGDGPGSSYGRSRGERAERAEGGRRGGHSGGSAGGRGRQSQGGRGGGR